jgi:flavodoxin I
MRTLIIYHSVFGNTEQVARTIADALKEAGPVQMASPAEAMGIDLAETDLLVVGSPTHNHGLPTEFMPFLEGMARGSLSGIRAAAFDTRNHQAKWLTGSAALKIAHQLRRAGCDIVLPPGSFFVAGREGPLENYELERAVDWARQILESADLASPTMA